MKLVNYKHTIKDTISVTKYFKDIYKIPLLTLEEEIELGEKIRQGDKEALDKLVRSNLRFVISVAKNYQNSKFDLATLISEGNLGLITAAKIFDPSKGFKFISLAVYCIRQSIQQYVLNKNSVIRFPYEQSRLINKIEKEITRFYNKHYRNPTIKELSNNLDVDEIAISNVYNYIRDLTLLDDVVANYSDDVSTSYIDLIPDANSTPPDENLMKESLRIDLLTALQRLPKNYPEIMISLYGIYCEKKSIVTLSKEYGLCEERIKQINKHCLKLLKENELNKDLKNYL